MELTASQRAFLDETHYGVLGTLNHDHTIQQTVIWFLREGNELRFSTAANSVKARNLRRDPTVSVTIEDGNRYLTLSGRATLEPVDESLRARMATRYLGAERGAEWLQQRPQAERVSVRIVVERAYGQGV